MTPSQGELRTCCRGLAVMSCALVMALGRMPAVFPQVRSSRLGKRLCTGACMGFTHFCSDTQPKSAASDASGTHAGHSSTQQFGWHCCSSICMLQHEVVQTGKRMTQNMAGGLGL